ncbi:hypothetical protein [Mucilaginibacter sp. BT774]|uniref:hypothetical protein n=1 Tax=Mucilaginibacter sp. BT774 TaxID=3062276 RepID=UPI0026776543|nr:hypothetical protein [Mucilaginibacter sp. BT774]MDO3625730.1 hypothetical protein [Mucilaginibacter sp. BT774]
MVASRPYIIYSLPKSRTTQALKGGKIEKVWDNIKLFLINCTTADIQIPNSTYLQGFSADEEHDESSILAGKVLQNTQEVFGIGRISSVAYHYPSNIPTKQIKIQWDLTANELSKAINYMIEGQPWPKYNLGPVELILSYDFKLIDPATKIELPNQQFTSSILFWLTKSNCICPSLCFPYEEPNEEFWEYIDSIEPFLPFKFDRKYLSLGVQIKKALRIHFLGFRIFKAV